MTGLRVVLVGVAIGLLLVAAFPADAHAWTHGTHIFLSDAILGNLKLLPSSVADLIGAFPHDFLYGSIAPDTSIAKRYVPRGRHSHFWHVGQETLDFAGSDQLRAFGLGYLTHLAADTIAHNFFVPRQLLLTSSSQAMGHQYWELRVETHLTDRFARRARDLILLDHTAADRHLEKIISPTLFSVATNRRIFRSIVHLSDTKSWQRAMQAARERSRWLLTDTDVERHLALSFDFVMETLGEAGAKGGLARKYDPSGETPLRRAKRWRREALWQGGLWEPERMLEVAEERFGLPSVEIGFWKSSVIDRPWLSLISQAELNSPTNDQGAPDDGQG